MQNKSKEVIKGNSSLDYTVKGKIILQQCLTDDVLTKCLHMSRDKLLSFDECLLLIGFPITQVNHIKEMKKYQSFIEQCEALKKIGLKLLVKKVDDAAYLNMQNDNTLNATFNFE